MAKKHLALFMAAAFLAAFLSASASSTGVSAWSNGGYSADVTHPDYGTHDWIAQHALDWLPANEKQYILDNLATYLYGTELPDNNQAPDGIGDTAHHHIYFRANGALQEDDAAQRANTEYQTALNYLNAKDYPNAAKTAGIMTHYIADVAVFAHVMGASTDWGAETGNNHPNYESYVNTRTSSYSGTFNQYLSYDGNLKTISAYNAAEDLANDTTFDHGGTFTCVWMNNNYNTSNPVYWNRTGESLNLAVNAVTDVLHTLYISSNIQTTPTLAPTQTPTPTTPAPSTPAATSSPSLTSSTTPTQASTPTSSPPDQTPTLATTSAPSPSIPEFPSGVLLAVLMFAVGASVVCFRKRSVKKAY